MVPRKRMALIPVRFRRFRQKLTKYWSRVTWHMAPTHSGTNRALAFYILEKLLADNKRPKSSSSGLLQDFAKVFSNHHRVTNAKTKCNYIIRTNIFVLIKEMQEYLDCHCHQTMHRLADHNNHLHNKLWWTLSTHLKTTF